MSWKEARQGRLPLSEAKVSQVGFGHVDVLFACA